MLFVSVQSLLLIPRSMIKCVAAGVSAINVVSLVAGGQATTTHPPPRGINIQSGDDLMSRAKERRRRRTLIGRGGRRESGNTEVRLINVLGTHIESRPEVEPCTPEFDVRYEVAARYLLLPTQTGGHFH